MLDHGDYTQLVTAVIAGASLIKANQAAKNSKPVSNGFVSSVNSQFTEIRGWVKEIATHHGVNLPQEIEHKTHNE